MTNKSRFLPKHWPKHHYYQLHSYATIRPKYMRNVYKYTEIHVFAMARHDVQSPYRVWTSYNNIHYVIQSSLSCMNNKNRHENGFCNVISWLCAVHLPTDLVSPIMDVTPGSPFVPWTLRWSQRASWTGWPSSETTRCSPGLGASAGWTTRPLEGERHAFIFSWWKHVLLLTVTGSALPHDLKCVSFDM